MHAPPAWYLFPCPRVDVSSRVVIRSCGCRNPIHGAISYPESAQGRPGHDPWTRQPVTVEKVKRL